MKANSYKCYLITSGSDEVIICVENYNINSSKSVNKLSFNNDIDKICKKPGQKLNAMSWITPYMDLPKRNAFL